MLRLFQKIILKISVIAAILHYGQATFAQRYNFKNYDIEDGLVQSQAQRIFQDSVHNLWISTFRGLSRLQTFKGLLRK
ncbi:MAG: hypothetical protein WBJ10_02370 [Daejeonella sp.]|uniref:hypothetical protein n=1 Tax=Daejeonella sp. TaxID=2805397 RepID=UPI003C769199